jgi:hypothetical protein
MTISPRAIATTPLAVLPTCLFIFVALPFQILLPTIVLTSGLSFKARVVNLPHRLLHWRISIVETFRATWKTGSLWHIVGGILLLKTQALALV